MGVQKVSSLSGGERNRLLLARLLTRPANVLVLDEPTNDLDLETLELLEARLVEFKGTVLVVSHDRTFLDNVCTSTLVFEGEEVVREYVGGHSDWRRVAERRETARHEEESSRSASKASQGAGKRRPRTPSRSNRGTAPGRAPCEWKIERVWLRLPWSCSRTIRRSNPG